MAVWLALMATSGRLSSDVAFLKEARWDIDQNAGSYHERLPPFATREYGKISASQKRVGLIASLKATGNEVI